jgi:hypothetical protein
MPEQIPVQPQSWVARNWKLLLGLLVALGVLGVAAVFGFLTLIMSSIKGSDVAREAMARARSNPAVVQHLGTPIEEGWLVSGSVNVSTGSGDADLALPISGPKAKGTVYVTAQKSAGAWTYSVMQAAIEGSGERIDLLAPAPMGQPSAAAPTPSPTPAAPSAPPATATASQPNAPAPNSSAAVSSDIIQSQDTNSPGVVGELIQCKRSGGVLSVKIRFHNTSGAPVGFYVLGPNISYEKFYVTAASKKYFILKDSDGTYLAPGSDYSCGMPGVCEKLAAGQSNTWWAKFPAPSADVMKVELFTPVTPPFDDIPITDN